MKPVRTPIRLQLDSTECGAVCLGIVLEHMGSFVAASELRDRCQVSRAGSNAATIVSAAEHYGLECKGLRVALDRLDSVSLPAIIHWRMNHFVVLEGVTSKNAWINDPAQGRRKILYSELADCFTGIVLTLKPLATYRPSGKRIGLIKSLWSQASTYRSFIVYCILAATLSVFPTIAFAVGSQTFIDKAIISGDTYFARPLTWILLAFALVQALVTWLRITTLNDLRVHLSNGLSENFLARLFQQNILFFSKRFPAEIASRINLSTGIAHAISHEFLESICGLLASILVLAVLFAVNSILASVVTVAFITVCVIMLAASGRRTGVSQQLAQSEGKLQATAIEAFSSVEALKGSVLEQFTFNRWHHFLRQSTQQRIELQQSTVLLSSLSGFVLSLTTTAIIGGGGLMVVSGRMTLGGLVAFQLLMPFLLGPLAEVVRLFGRLQFVSADLMRYTDVTNAESSPVDSVQKGTTTSSLPISQQSQNSGIEIVCDGLSFSYGYDKQVILNCVSFSVRAGEWLGVTGASGCGKTTLARTLARLYAPQQGTVRFNGLDSQSIDTAKWHSLVGYGDQQTSLLPGTMREHLRGEQKNLSDESILHALDLVGLKDTISRLHNGLGTWLDEDSLSGGELQRIGIARLLISPVRCLILDEMTSSLDAETEAKVLQALRAKEITVVFISHRPAVLQGCQKVLYLEDGIAVRIDSHDNLMRCEPGYSRLLGELP